MISALAVLFEIVQRLVYYSIEVGSQLENVGICLELGDHVRKFDIKADSVDTKLKGASRTLKHLLKSLGCHNCFKFVYSYSTATCITLKGVLKFICD